MGESQQTTALGMIFYGTDVTLENWKNLNGLGFRLPCTMFFFSFNYKGEKVSFEENYPQNRNELQIATLENTSPQCGLCQQFFVELYIMKQAWPLAPLDFPVLPQLHTAGWSKTFTERLINTALPTVHHSKR